MQASELKGLCTRRQDALSAVKAAQTEIDRLNAEILQTEQKLAALKEQKTAEEKTLLLKQQESSRISQEIEKRSKKSNKVVISEHAMLRYIERVVGYTPDAIRKQMLPKAVESQILAKGDGEYCVNGGFTIRVRDGVIVTIVS